MWFEDEELSSQQEALRKSCHFCLLLLSPTPSSEETIKKNTALLKMSLDRLLGKVVRKSVDLEAGCWSHFLSLTFPDLIPAAHLLPQLRIGADAFELRVDLLEDLSPHNVHCQVAHLRASAPLPIVFTVRTRAQIGRHPDDDYEGIKALLLEGLRAGVEWLDVEASLPAPVLDAVLAIAARRYSPCTRILGSLHATAPQTSGDMASMFRRAALDGRADLLKVVTGTGTGTGTGGRGEEDCRRVHVAGEAAAQALGRPYIGLCLGAQGELSRVLNRRFTPITHEALAAAAPGQLTARELTRRRRALGLLQPRQFHLFGTPIRHSLSPGMQNAGFQALALPHSYSLLEAQGVSSYREAMRAETFGGASVTIPHKESILPLLDRASDVARQIGAANTVLVAEGGQLVGHNTDWLGMRRPIARALGLAGAAELSGGTGLVIGAGTSDAQMIDSLCVSRPVPSGLVRSLRAVCVQGARPELRATPCAVWACSWSWPIGAPPRPRSWQKGSRAARWTCRSSRSSPAPTCG